MLRWMLVCCYRLFSSLGSWLFLAAGLAGVLHRPRGRVLCGKLLRWSRGHLPPSDPVLRWICGCSCVCGGSTALCLATRWCRSDVLLLLFAVVVAIPMMQALLLLLLSLLLLSSSSASCCRCCCSCYFECGLSGASVALLLRSVQGEGG